MAEEREKAQELRYLAVAGDRSLLGLIARRSWLRRRDIAGEDGEDVIKGVVDVIVGIKSRSEIESEVATVVDTIGHLKVLTDHLADTARLNAGPVFTYEKELEGRIAVRKKTASDLGYKDIPFDGADKVLVVYIQRSLQTGARAGDRSRR